MLMLGLFKKYEQCVTNLSNVETDLGSHSPANLVRDLHQRGRRVVAVADGVVDPLPLDSVGSLVLKFKA